MLPPPSPLAPSTEPTPDRGGQWLRTIGAALLLPTVGFVLTWGSELVQSCWPRPLHVPPVGIVPLLGPGWVTVALTVTVAFGAAPGVLIALVDRRRPYVAAAVAPAVFAFIMGGFCLVTTAAANRPHTPAGVWLALILLLPLGAWLSAAAGIALVRSARRA